MKKYIIIIIALLIIGAIYLMWDANRKYNVEQDRVFIKDSSSIASLDTSFIYDPNELKSRYKAFRIKSDEYPRYLSLIEIIDSLKIETDTASIRVEWETGRILRNDSKFVTLYFRDYFYNQGKFIPDTIYIATTRLGKKALSLQKKYGWKKDDCITVAERRIRIGMTDAMVREAWGKPEDINRTTTTYGVHEQWVYESGNYCYFDDGILTTIQN
jgi:hypothetical protein